MARPLEIYVLEAFQQGCGRTNEICGRPVPAGEQEGSSEQDQGYAPQ